MKAFAVYLLWLHSLFVVGISQTIKDNGSLKKLPKFQMNCAFPQSTLALCTHWPNAKSLSKDVIYYLSVLALREIFELFICFFFYRLFLNRWSL